MRISFHIMVYGGERCSRFFGPHRGLGAVGGHGGAAEPDRVAPEAVIRRAHCHRLLWHAVQGRGLDRLFGSRYPVPLALC